MAEEPSLETEGLRPSARPENARDDAEGKQVVVDESSGEELTAWEFTFVLSVLAIINFNEAFQ